MPKTLVALAVVLSCAVATGRLHAGSRAAVAADPCAGRGTVLLVRTGEHVLRACHGGRTEARYRVALGFGGIGKSRQGDGKTPLGAYPLGAPRRSSSYHVFVPVGYPTARQQRAGFTGSAIGIHGPSRGLPQNGVTTLVDWTAGCIAVGSDDEVRRLAAFVRDRAARQVEIE